MSILRLVFFSLFLGLGSAAFAKEIGDYDFQQERMLLSPDSVIVISSFESKDHITAYSYNGIYLWNAPFHAKILSWQMVDGYLFVFSKDRKGSSTYITCLNRYTGEMIWQRP